METRIYTYGQQERTAAVKGIPTAPSRVFPCVDCGALSELKRCVDCDRELGVGD